MKYYSLNGQAPAVSFETATVQGQAPDSGLYFPQTIPQLSEAFLKQWKRMPKEDLAFEVMRPYVGGSIPGAQLREIAAATISFDFPLVPVTDSIHALELFHGPTLAFKDVGARFMSRCLGFFNRNKDRKTTVLVATSGDTGGAVANGFLGVEGVEVIILYPSGKVSPVQELQLTTCGHNIVALEVQGTFDDCQAIVKRAFTDKALRQRYELTSANSINVARWLPQQLYYFFALQQWAHKEPPIISVPSGNFGNLCAGILARKSGLPTGRFIAACNVNDTVPRYLESGIFEARPAIATISNAMDVGLPSNFARIETLLQKDINALRELLAAYRIDDETTRATIKRVFREHHYTLDPHGAVAYTALEKYLASSKPEAKGIFIETAHPVKFPDVVEQETGRSIPLPPGTEKLLKRQKQSIRIPARYDAVKEWLLMRHRA